jgi:hypothetical protein
MGMSSSAETSSGGLGSSARVRRDDRGHRRRCPDPRAQLTRLPPALALQVSNCSLSRSGIQCVYWPSRSFQPGSQSRHRLYRSLTRLPACLPSYATRRDPATNGSCSALEAVASRPPRSQWHHGSWSARRTPAGLSPPARDGRPAP